MALADDEQRRLNEIERELAEDEPRLARRFAHDRVTAPTVVALVVAAGLMLAAGVTLIVTGARLGLPVVVGVGVVVAAVVPVMAWAVRR